jgi:perosamine synthetase
MLAMLGGEPLVATPRPHTMLESYREADRASAMLALERLERADGAAVRDYLAEYEAMLADYHGRKHALLTNSGTSALHSAYFGLRLEPGDEVVAPTNTFFATVTAVLAAGAIPVLADCEPDTGNIDVADVARRLTPRTKAVVVTHQWGHPVEMDPLLDLVRERRLALVEDASLALGATYRGRRVGSFGDVAVLSLGGGKLVSGGQGGVLLTDDDEVLERATLLGHPFRPVARPSGRYAGIADTCYGHNYRMHPVAAAISRARFERLDDLIAARHARLELLSSLLAEGTVLAPPVTRPYVFRGSWGGYLASYDEDRTGVPIEIVGEALVAEGLECSPRGYHPLVHRTPLFRRDADGYRGTGPCVAGKAVHRDGDFPAAERHADSRMGLPTFVDEPLDLVRLYGAAVRKVSDHVDDLRDRIPA